MTDREAILIILINAGIDPNHTVNENTGQTAFDVLETHINGALDDIEETV